MSNCPQHRQLLKAVAGDTHLGGTHETQVFASRHLRGTAGRNHRRRVGTGDADDRDGE
ncbi:hypothetical protein RHIZ404_200083 [Rhizobium sp. EC-SD404]|nr:hypothetical protein RHIZ404_200083 [Rhizobium sp. EC-SD404]